MILGEQTGTGPHIDYIPDALGSVVAAVDQNLVTTYTAAYSPFGDVIASTGTAPNLTWVGTLGYLQSAGRPFAEYSVRNRIYSSTTGRWTSVDPYWPTEPPYGYFLGNPVNRNSLSIAYPCVAKLSGGDSKCPPGVLSGITDAWKAACTQLGNGMTDAQLSSLAKCAEGRMPRSCRSWPRPPLSQLSQCLQNWCKRDPALTITCDGSDVSCKNNCAVTYCFGNPPLNMITTNICPSAYGSDCKPAKGCGNGGNYYGAGTYSTPKGTPPWTQVLLHELIHDCVTCRSSNGNPNCMETYTQAITACLITGGWK